MFNFLDKIKSDTTVYRQFQLDRQLITEFNCPLERPKQAMWSEQGYFVYVLEGKKIWHLPERSFELQPGQCIYVRQGAHIVEQFFDARFCVIIFFVSDPFITDTLTNRQIPPLTEPVASCYPVDANDTLHAFFQSIAPYFYTAQPLSPKLLELKFRELILNVADNPANAALLAYFGSLHTNSGEQVLRNIMESNFRFNLPLKDFARLCGKSLSGFKRDFQMVYGSSPGKWLLEKRLLHARQLLAAGQLSISEVAYECGFENLSHFSRSFRQQFGSSPSAWREP